MSENKIEYNLLEGTPTRTFSVQNGFASVADARAYAENRQIRQLVEYKIQEVITTRTTIDSFTIVGLAPPSLEEIAANMSTVYAQSIDWEDEDYLALSKSDKLLVCDMVNEATDDCSNCGWTFELHYLNDGVNDLLCDRCESELEEEEENDEE